MGDSNDSGWKPPAPDAGPPRSSRPPPGPLPPASEPPAASAPPAEGAPSPALPRPAGPGPGWFGQVASSGYVPSDQEREYAFYAHLAAAILAFVSCSFVFPVVAPIVVYAVAKEKPPFLLFHVHQSLLFQAACSALQIVITTTGALSSFFCVGWMLFLLGLVPWLGASIYAFVVGLWARNGEWRGYPFLTDKLLHTWKPFLN
jgi:uncharacterized Tic20 family protein